jgi:hypothetical protein
LETPFMLVPFQRIAFPRTRARPLNEPTPAIRTLPLLRVAV